MDIGNMIDKIAEKDFAGAQKDFDDLMGDRVEAALEGEKMKVAGAIFNGDEDLDDEDVSDEDLEDAAAELVDEDEWEESDEDE